MTTQNTVFSGLPNGLTLTNKLFTLADPDVVAYTSDSTVNRTNATDEYVFAFGENVAISGVFTSKVFLGSRVLATGKRTFAGTDGETAIVTPEAAALDSATAAQITAIETFATRVTTGIVQDGAAWQFTANMLELGPSGTVSVLPATGIVANRTAGTTLVPVIGETISQAITVYQSDGTTAVNLSGKTLKIIFETMSGTDVAVVLAADITISGTSSNVVTFAYPSAVTASERVLRFAIRDAAAPLTMYLQGVCSVVAAPKVDA